LLKGSTITAFVLTAYDLPASMDYRLGMDYAMLANLIKRLARQPTAHDNKYTRGTVGFVTGSDVYPGAAVLGVGAAQQTGVGLVRYVGPKRAADLVLQSHPEVIAADRFSQAWPAQAWVIGSGISGTDDFQRANINDLLADPRIAVVDAGALEILDFGTVSQSSLLLTPHLGELIRLLNKLTASHDFTKERFKGLADVRDAAALAARFTGQTVLVKGNINVLALPLGQVIEVGPTSVHLATAGSGDVLAGILGGLAAANPELAETYWLDIATLGILLHSEAAVLAAKSGLVTASTISSGVAQILNERLAG
jgi:hydroxyethylthiazole kinase-like uncharacterized protein yjeF